MLRRLVLFLLYFISKKLEEQSLLHFQRPSYCKFDTVVEYTIQLNTLNDAFNFFCIKITQKLYKNINLIYFQ